MIKLRTMTTAFLMNKDDILVMRRSMDREFAPGIWTGVGGHLEPDEINSPEKACLREILEETGVDDEYIENLDLKYIILRRSKFEIRIQYVYLGTSLKRELIQCDEGDLFWLHKDSVLDKKLTATTRMTLEHFLKTGGSHQDVLVGTVSADKNNPVMNWCPVQDWEGIL